MTDAIRAALDLLPESARQEREAAEVELARLVADTARRARRDAILEAVREAEEDAALHLRLESRTEAMGHRTGALFFRARAQAATSIAASLRFLLEES